MTSLSRKILALGYALSSLFVLISASAHSDLSKLQETRNSLNFCQVALIGLQELITSATTETTTPSKDSNSTSPSTAPTSYPTDSTFPFDNITYFEDNFPTTEILLTTTYDTLEATNATEMEELSSTTETALLIESTTNAEERSTVEVTGATTAGELFSFVTEPRVKRDIENSSNDIDKSHDNDDEGGSWGILVMNAMTSMGKTLYEISDDPFDREYSAALNLSTKHLNELITQGKEDKELVLESNCESLQNASRETLSILSATKKVVKTEIKRATSTKMGTIAVICLVSILLAFVIIALVCVLLKPWRRCCKKKGTTSKRSSSSSTYSNYYRKTSALEGIRNFSYVESTEPASAPAMSIAAMSIPSISIPRPTVIRMSDRYQPSSSTLRNNCSSREFESIDSLQRSYLSYT